MTFSSSTEEDVDNGRMEDVISIPFDEIARIGDDPAHFADGNGEMIRDEDETIQVEDYPDAREVKRYDKELKNFTPLCV